MSRITPFHILPVLLLAAGTALAQTEVTGTSLNIYSHSADSANNVLSNSGSAAFGKNNTVPVNFSYALGDRNTVGQYAVGSFTTGVLNSVTGTNALCLGGYNTVSGAFCLTLGRYLKASASRSFVIGTGLGDNARLECGADNQLMVGFQSTKPTLTVTGSPNDYGQGVVEKTGKVAIGDVTPLAKLHIRSDAGEDAAIILEPKQPGSSGTFIRLRDGSHKLSVSSSGVMSLTAGGYPLGLTGGALSVSCDNFSVSGSRLNLGTDMQRRFVVTAQDAPSIYSNAYPGREGQYRYVEGPSYALAFGTGALTIRTAVNQEPRGSLITNWQDPLIIGTDGKVTLNGKVGVNTANTTSDYALAVDGGIITTKVHIQVADDWPDYVFGDGYRLMAAGQLRSYIGDHGHLPGIPSASEVEERGYDVADMQAALLRQVEELTLRVLDQQELIDRLLAASEGRWRVDRLPAAGDTVRFTYDACGNRVGRTLEFSRDTDTRGGDVTRNADGGMWLAALDDSLAGSAMALFPNPTEGRFTLSFPGGVPDGATAALLAPTGAALSERVLHGNDEEFDLSAQPAGVYLLRLSAAAGTRTFKVIKRN